MTKAVFTITLDVAPVEAAYVKWATVDGSASAMLNGRNDTAVAEYGWARGYATFQPGQTQATVEIDVAETVASQHSLTFYLVLYDAYNCVVDTTPAKCVISYNGSTAEAPTDTIEWYQPSGDMAQVAPLPDSWTFVSFSGPENARWWDKDNPLNRNGDWITERYVKYYSQYGLKYMRLCSAWDVTQNNLWGDLDPIALRMQRQSAFFCAKYGIGSVISQHSNSQFAIEGCIAVLGDGIFTVRAYTDTMTKITRAFGDIPQVVALALNSEPAGPSLHGMANATWWQYAKAGLAAVRALNHQLYVLVDAAGGAATPLHWADNNAGFTNIVDPAGRIYMVSDIYVDAYSAGVTYFMDQVIAQGDGLAYNHPIDSTIGAYRIAYTTPWLRQYGQRLLIGETAAGAQDKYGAVGFGKWRVIMDAWARSCWSQGIPLGIWCASGDFNTVYNAGAGVYLNRYPYALDPVGSSLRYGPYEAGPEAPPLTIFKRWFQPDISVTYKLQAIATITGASAQIECIAAFAAPWPFTATIDDGGAGGSLPGGDNTIAFAAASSQQIQTVTYTPPAGTAAVTLALGNSVEPLPLPTEPTLQKLFFDMDLFGTLGLAPAAVLWPVRLVKGYTGAAVTLLRSDRGATRDFAYSAGGSPSLGIGAAVDASVVAAWDAGTPLVVRYHDQSGNGRDATPYQGETCQWSTDGSPGPAASPSDYPRYMVGRDVPYLVPHFGADFGDFAKADQLCNRMDMALPIDGALDYAWVLAFGATVQVGQNDFIASYNYTADAKNYVVGPSGAVQMIGAQTGRGLLDLALGGLNIVEVYYTGGAVLNQQSGTAVYAAAPKVTMADGTVIVADVSASKVTVTPHGGSATTYTAAVVYPGSLIDLRWQDSSGHYNRLLTAWDGAATWFVTDGNGSLTCWLNGQQVLSVPAAGFLSDPYNGVLNLFWDRFYLSNTVADCIGLVAIPGPVTADQRSVLYHTLRASLARDAAS